MIKEVKVIVGRNNLMQISCSITLAASIGFPKLASNLFWKYFSDVLESWWHVHYCKEDSVFIIVNSYVIF